MSDPIDAETIFTCQKCGQCCRGYGGTFVVEKEIQAIADYLKIDTRQVIARFCELSGGKVILAQGENGYCILWDQQCTIHPVKPEMCKKWPFIESLLVDPKNWQAMASSCPGMRKDAPEKIILECVKEVLSSYDRRT
jgi:Fe-S-cluster containining protein